MLSILLSSNSFAFGFHFKLLKFKMVGVGGTVTYVDGNGLNPRSSPAYIGGYTIHTFNGSGNFTVSGGSGSLDY